MLERAYQARLIKTIRKLFPGCIVLKNDPTYLQGVPDLVIFYNDRWAMLEVKNKSIASVRPNQQYYVDTFNSMSYAAFIHPDNEADILDELQYALQSR